LIITKDRPSLMLRAAPIVDLIAVFWVVLEAVDEGFWC